LFRDLTVERLYRCRFDGALVVAPAKVWQQATVLAMSQHARIRMEAGFLAVGTVSRHVRSTVMQSSLFSAPSAYTAFALEGFKLKH